MEHNQILIKNINNIKPGFYSECKRTQINGGNYKISLQKSNAVNFRFTKH